MIGRLMDGKRVLGHVHLDTSVADNTIGRVIIKTISIITCEREFTCETEMVTAITAASYQLERVNHMTRAEVNNPPDKPLVVNNERLKETANVIIKKLDDPTELVKVLFPKPYGQMTETEMADAIEKVRTCWNIMRTVALEKGVKIRQEQSSINKIASKDHEDRHYSKSPSARKTLIKNGGKVPSGDKEMTKLYKLVIEFGLQDKYPGYQSFSKEQLKGIVKEGFAL